MYYVFSILRAKESGRGLLQIIKSGSTTTLLDTTFGDIFDPFFYSKNLYFKRL